MIGEPLTIRERDLVEAIGIIREVFAALGDGDGNGLEQVYAALTARWPSWTDREVAAVMRASLSVH